MSSLTRKFLFVAVVFTETSLLMAPFCGWMFGCGCSWLWTTADQLCNVHRSTPPHCPWCSHGTFGMIAPFFGLLAGAFVPGGFALRAWTNLPLVLGLSLACQLIVGILLGRLTLLITHYPHI